MSNKMLIDASHPEETRVAVVRGNRIEEFDFESQEKKQLRGNIYLAKVTRVEPSLQAAFIDYGGNRHGFLAFSEIHPDYYQIPVADRQALLEAEAEEARASQEAEEAEDDVSNDDTEVAEKPKKSRRRRSKKAAASEAETVSDETSSEEDKAAVEETTTSDETDNNEETVVAETVEPAEVAEEPEAEKPKRRTTRRKTKAKPAEEVIAEEAEEASESAENGDTDEPTTMAAMVETDSISEPLPGEDGEESGDGDDAPVEEASAEPEEVEEKPKRKRTTRTRSKKAEPKVEAEAAEDEAVADAPAETAASEEAKSETAADADSEQTEEKPAKPKRRSRRKKPAAETKASEEAEAKSDDDSEDSGEDDSVESVGQDDALEEVPAPRRSRKQYKIQEVIKRRQILLVQVVKEERGNKGAALTTYLSLAGRYSVLMPNTARGGGISRKITNAADRKRLKTIASELEVPEGMGVILRTAGASRTNVEIDRDFQYLMRLWEQVRSLTLSSTAPCLVYEEGSLIKRSIRDLYDKDTGEVLVAGEQGYEEAKEFMGMLMPSHVKKVKQYTDSQAIFAKFGVEAHLENMVSPQVTLKSGGYLIINQTEALVAVDVNSGRATREHSIENTALKTNLEAAEEVARQLRLRDLAGLVVIDFIDMEERRNNRAVEKKIKDCLKSDRARIQVGRISHFGLLEMSRQRIRASVLESTMDVCSHCGGVGHVRSESAIALHVFRALEEHVARNRKWDAVVRTTPEIAAHILNFKRAALLELEQKFGVQITVIGDASKHGQQFDVEKGERAKAVSAPKAVGYDGDSAEDNGEEEGRGRKRGRRRKRNDNSDDVETSETESSTEDEPKIAAPETSEEDDGQPRKKRRRGKRGGRRRKEEGSEAEASEEASEASVETEQAPASVEASEPATAQEAEAVEEEKPKSRSTRRKKAPIAPKRAEAEAEPAVEAEEASKPVAEEPPKPKRRTTRRKPVAEESETETAPDTVVAEATESDSVSEEPQTDAEGKPKKSGWWNRGGGFF